MIGQSDASLSSRAVQDVRGNLDVTHSGVDEAAMGCSAHYVSWNCAMGVVSTVSRPKPLGPGLPSVGGVQGAGDNRDRLGDGPAGGYREHGGRQDGLAQHQFEESTEHVVA